MSHHLVYRLLLAASLLLGYWTTASAAQFSADMVQNASGMTQSMRYYMGDQMMRTEIKDESGQAMASIVDLKARKMIQLMPAEKMYIELPLGDEAATWAADSKTQQQYYEMKHVGSETVNGYACDKYELIPKQAGLERSTTWIAKKLGYPIRTVGKGFSMDLKNIKEGTQPAALFQVPAGYQRMTMPGFGTGGHGSTPMPPNDGKGALEGLRGLFGAD